MEETGQVRSQSLDPIVSASPLAIIALDRAGNITSWSPAAERIFGWSWAEVLGRPLPYVPRERQEEFRALQARELYGEALQGVEIRRHRKNGSPLDLRLWTAPIHDSAGQIVGSMGLLQDITEQKRTEETLARHTLQLEALQAMGADIARELDLASVLRLVLQHAVRLLGGTGGALYLWDETQQLLVPQVWQGVPENQRSMPLRLGEALSGRVAEQRKGIRETDYCTSPHAHPEALSLTAAAVCAEPLVIRGTLLGVITIGHRTVGREFTEEDQGSLRLLALQSGIAITNARLFEQVRKNQDELHRLSQRLVAVQEEERRRISRELHDEAGQALTALRIGLDLIRQELPDVDARLRQRLDEAVALADATMVRVRELARALRPPALEALGLTAALEGHCRLHAGRTGLPIAYEGAAIPGLPDAIAVHLLRCLQEALTNVSKHAKATHVRVVLSHDGARVRLVVEDDGEGFDPAAVAPGSGIGLAGMRERLSLLHGMLEIAPRPGGGNRLTASVPWRGPG